KENLESLEEGLEIRDREAEMMASREMGRVFNRRGSTPWTFRQIVGWVPLNKMEIE
ncbi:hypothetical protein A2U01_0043182, partial [Trifolium medium]|nr:hypothetical protein [Trifolium medium]